MASWSLGFAMPIFSFLNGTPSLLRRGLAWVCLAGVAWGKGAEKPIVIPLTELGQPAAGGRPQVPGSTQATVHFVGEHYVLVTFPVRRLMKRLPDSEPEDDDRTIDAVLVEVPSGKVAARTSWRVHDSGQYLWELGRGRFMIRVRNTLVTVAPLANLSTEHLFEERTLLSFERQIVGVIVSAEGDLLTVETRERKPVAVTKAGRTTSRQTERPVEIDFFRVEAGGHPVQLSSAGRILSQGAVEIPMTRDGYLDANEEKKGVWVFDYLAHGGKKTELSPYDTTCFPQAKFVSRSEFVAFGCRGSSEKIEIGGFNMKGEEMWQQNFFETFVHPTFSFAPEAGRFALGRALTAPGAGSSADTEALTGQDVVVIQEDSGKQIFHTVVTPAQRSGQNFALAPDGSEVAVIRSGVLEVHRLAGATGKEQQAVKAARDIPLERAAGAIVLPTRGRVTVAATAAESSKTDSGFAAVPVTMGVKPAAAAVPAKSVVNTIQVGDAQDDAPRKAPTLYGPDEAGRPH